MRRRIVRKRKWLRSYVQLIMVAVIWLPLLAESVVDSVDIEEIMITTIEETTVFVETTMEETNMEETTMEATTMEETTTEETTTEEMTTEEMTTEETTTEKTTMEETTVEETTTLVVTTTTTTTTTMTEAAIADATYTVEYGSDVYMLAYAMAKEAEYGNWTDACYVGNVILNRVDDEDFPNSVIEVITEPGQYSWANSTPYYRDEIYSDYLYEIATSLLNGNRPLPGGVVFQSQNILGEIYCTVGVHYYCYK